MYNVWHIIVFTYIVLKQTTNPCTRRTHLPTAIKAQMRKSKIPSNDCFFDIHGIVCTFIGFPEHQTINQYHYLHILADEFREKIRKKLPELEGQVMGSPPRQYAGSFHIICQEVSSQV
ncbi:hypothetical protein TNCV_3697901 [Trichonephila clavipes]|uniref:Uncharacterized protein n=1 Tax=Trichonephila clavipes TaxID=2585209 RepID=A0A8X6SMW5_TRICX|nr:hypothetical protein TNCV_3697901 [Trichonephila clavipes]